MRKRRLPAPDVPPDRHRLVALFTALVVGLFGIYPHLRWSVELNQPAWFFNSYNKGFYGWLSFHEFSLNRSLSSVVMHALYFASGSNPQLAMILADFFLPCGVALAGCYMVRPLFVSAAGMAAGAFTVLVSAECLALRNTSIPYAQIHTFLHDKVVPLAGGAAGILQIDNQTSTFWLFRTPEPQVSWIVMFLTLGLAIRLVLSPVVTSRRACGLAAVSILLGTGCLFCALCVGGAFVLFALLAARSSFRHAFVIGASGLLCLGVCLGLSFGPPSSREGNRFFLLRIGPSLPSVVWRVCSLSVLYCGADGPTQACHCPSGLPSPWD